MKKDTIKILSLDIPWGAEKNVGAAFAEVQGGDLVNSPRVTSVNSASALMSPAPVLPESCEEVTGFIENGAGPGRVHPADVQGPFNAFPHEPATRRAYLERLWYSFHTIRETLKLQKQEIDLVLVDMPTVPAPHTALLNGTTSVATFRPVETAFGNRVMIPGASSAGRDGRIQFARFQPGIIKGCRPAYAVFHLAKRAFTATSVVESFPQLVLGPLSEFARSRDISLITRLAAHKSGNAASLQPGQSVLVKQLVAFLGENEPRWLPEELPDRVRGDGFDALLGLLPGLVHAGFAAPGATDAPWRRAILLKNSPPDSLPLPTSNGAGNPATGCRAWICTHSSFSGVDDSGILTLDLELWG